SSSSINSNLTRSRSLSDDSHRAQALEDCILFLNSSSSSSSSSSSFSSSLKRTNSVSCNSF
ncbi:hypothetical protein K7X86_00720, partial [Candidatus Sulcia muelleri]|nr:hypothetical protein [Candidatus Karelsulcia muelleri]